MFGVEAWNFLGFLLTKRGIEANPDKCAMIIGMRSPTNVKEVQQVIGRMVALSRFLSASGDKGYPYFQWLEKNNHFVWTSESEESFTELKEYLASPPVLGKPAPRILIRLYFVIIDRTIRSILLQEQDKVQRPVYFVSKVLQGPETQYQDIEKATLPVVFATRRLRHYFQSFIVIVMTDLPIRKVLQKPYIVGRMVC